jgi:hypothetical protein
MSFYISDAFVQQFSGNVSHLAQQRYSRLGRCVFVDEITGESAYLEQMAPAAARKVLARHEDSPIMNTQSLRRRIAPYDYEWGDLIDKEDQVRLLIDPESNYAKAGGMAMERSKDDEIIASFFGTAYTGHSGSTAVTWPNGNTESTPSAPGGYVVAVNSWAYGNGSGNAGLTISKLIEAKVALDQAEADEEDERYLVISGKALGQLLATTEATNEDYNSVKALVKGEITEFLGFKFIRSERLLTDSNGYRRCVAFTKTGIGLGIAKDIYTKVAERPDKRFSWYVYAAESLGAARLEEARLVEIKCLNA